MVASSRKKKSRHGITTRKNRQSVSTAEGSSSHLNRTESSHSNNVGSAFNMIPCFPASNGTDAHHGDTISDRSSPSQFTKDSPSNISQVRTGLTTINPPHKDAFDSLISDYLRRRVLMEKFDLYNKEINNHYINSFYDKDCLI